MTGVVAAIATSGQNAYYSTGLVLRQYLGFAGADPNFPDSRSPISTVVFEVPILLGYTGTTNRTALWTGYIRPRRSLGSATTFQLNISGNFGNNYNFMWLGAPAVSGRTGGNALMTGTGTLSASAQLIPGQYVPLRIQVAYNGDNSQSRLTFTLLVDGVVGFDASYNTLTMGV